MNTYLSFSSHNFKDVESIIKELHVSFIEVSNECLFFDQNKINCLSFGKIAVILHIYFVTCFFLFFDYYKFSQILPNILKQWKFLYNGRYRTTLHKIIKILVYFVQTCSCDYLYILTVNLTRLLLIRFFFQFRHVLTDINLTENFLLPWR